MFTTAHTGNEARTTGLARKADAATRGTATRVLTLFAARSPHAHGLVEFAVQLRLHHRSANASAGLARDPLDRRDGEAGARDAIDGSPERLECYRHVVGVGMQQQESVDHDADVPLPENQVTALEAVQAIADRHGDAELGLLHIAVAGAIDAGGVQGSLQQARAIDA